MKRLTPRQSLRVGTVGLVLTTAITLAALQVARLPFVATPAISYAALFDDASGLAVGDDVSAGGVRVGGVTAITVDAGHARVEFAIDPDIALGDTTTAAIKTVTLLGRRAVELNPAGTGRQHAGSTIPLRRTRSGYTLPTVLNEVDATVRDIDLNQLTHTLDAASDVLTATAPQLGPALDGVKALAASLNQRDAALRSLLAGAATVTSALAQRGPQVNQLLLDGNALLGELQDRSQALGALVTGIDEVSQQLSGMVHDNDAELTPALNNLGAVLAVVRKNNDNLARALQGLAVYVGTLGDAVASGPYFYAFVQNLIPGNFTQPLINAVLGLPPAPLPIPRIK